MRYRPIRISNGDGITRRDFLWLSSMAAAGLMAGCATNPVTGKSQFMLISEDDEIKLDKQNSLIQFSADYGPVQDKNLNDYIDRTGKNLAKQTHRPHLPYSFRAVNATYVNAYAFPGGSIAVTRGILLALENEAELAALLGHELGHVNARHTAQQMSKAVLTQTVVGSVSVLAGTQGALYGQLASQVGAIGAGALLASYSRDNEREADGLAMEYMVRSDYNPKGMIGLMEMLQNLSKRKPGAIELMFATHPMGEERYKTVVQTVNSKYKSALNRSLYRERYMDNTTRLRALKGPIEEMQNGEKEMGKRNFSQADAHFRQALKLAPDDYAALVYMATSQLIQKNYAVGRQYADMAQKVYPQEAQAYHLSGFAKIQIRDFEGAVQEFATCQQVLPGNPNTIFFKGYAYEGAQNIKQAASEYHHYLQTVQQGDKAQYAYNRLRQWGYYR